MTIEIHEPELEVLIQQRMEAGGFLNVEETLMQALKAAPAPELTAKPKLTGTGADIVAAFQACPVKDFEFDQAPVYSVVREVEF